MIATNQFKNGLTILLNGQIYSIVSFQHVKPGKGGAFVRTKLRNLESATVVDKTFRAGEKVEQAFIEEKKMQFLYHQDDMYHFMDQTTFEDMVLSKKQLAEKKGYLKENMELAVAVYKGKIVDIKLPTFVELKIDHTEPGLRADTVKAGSKTAVLETGAQIGVPLFVNKGDKVKIDTRTGRYVGRV
jgi:elongation factor P